MRAPFAPPLPVQVVPERDRLAMPPSRSPVWSTTRSGCERTGRWRIESAVPDVAAFWAAMRDGWESSNAADVPAAPCNRSLRDKRGLVSGTIFSSPLLDSLWVANTIETADPLNHGG